MIAMTETTKKKKALLKEATEKNSQAGVVSSHERQGYTVKPCLKQQQKQPNKNRGTNPRIREELVQKALAVCEPLPLSPG